MTITQINAIGKINDSHLTSVIDSMMQLGTPTIYYVDIAGANIALGGTHRIAAAYILGLTPNFVEVAYEDLNTYNDGQLDLTDCATPDDAADAIYPSEGCYYNFNDIEAAG